MNEKQKRKQRLTLYVAIQIIITLTLTAAYTCQRIKNESQQLLTGEKASVITWQEVSSVLNGLLASD